LHDWNHGGGLGSVLDQVLVSVVQFSNTHKWQGRMDQMSKHSVYQNLLGHMRYHNVKGWLLDGCKRESAQTIMKAVENIPKH
jgi:hypothetical protein